MNEGQKKMVSQMMDALELDQYGEKGLKEIIRQMAVEIVKRSDQPIKKPLSDYILSKEIDIIKKDSDFSNVRPWQIYYLARRIEELHGIGGSDEY